MSGNNWLKTIKNTSVQSDSMEIFFLHQAYNLKQIKRQKLIKSPNLKSKSYKIHAVHKKYADKTSLYSHN